MPLQDLMCTKCPAERIDYQVVNGFYPPCLECGGHTTWKPFVAHTDVLGSEHVAPMLKDASGNILRYTSTRERDQKMAASGFTPAGDKEHGARNEDRYKQSVTSYPGQTRRHSPRPPLTLKG